MNGSETSVRLTVPVSPSVGPLLIRTWHALASRRHELRATARGLIRELLVPVLAALLVALMVLLSGEAVGQTAVVMPPSSPPLDPVTGVDIRDSAVANGMVTPWMERATMPDPSVTP